MAFEMGQLYNKSVDKYCGETLSIRPNQYRFLWKRKGQKTEFCLQCKIFFPQNYYFNGCEFYGTYTKRQSIGIRG